MIEYAAPAMARPDPMANLTDAVAQHAHEAPGAVLFSRRRDERWVDVTAVQFHQEVVALAKGFVAAGIQPGDRVALLSPTRYEWTLADYAIWFAGAVGVPIYETSSAEQIAWILSDSGAVACVAGTAALAKTVESIREHAPELGRVWTIDAGDLDRLAAEGVGVADAEIARRREQMSGETVATLIYTSGTTGRPKGCELTHANFVELAANARAALSEVIDAPGACTLLFLPLAHVFARFIQVVCVAARVRMGHTSDVRSLLPALAEFRPTFLLAVPRVFEKIYNGAEARAAGSGKGKVFRRATETAVAFSEAQDAGGPSLLLRVRHAVFDRLVFAKLRAATGGRVTCAVSGGAPLGARLGHFFRGAGITIYEGWGLTETTAPATANTPKNLRIGTVGQPLPGVAVRVDGDGELLVRGVNVMRGYHNNPEATAQAMDGEWFHTGDIGEIDADGFVRITGRKKEIIVTAAGKNVAPMVLEDRLRGHPLISQAMVVGDQRPFIAALITLDAEMLPTWLANHGRPALDLAAATTDEAVLAEVGRAVDDANTLVSRAESIRTFRILDTDFTEASGHLTPKLSIKRHAVMKDFAAQIDAIYS